MEWQKKWFDCQKIRTFATFGLNDGASVKAIESELEERKRELSDAKLAMESIATEVHILESKLEAARLFDRVIELMDDQDTFMSGNKFSI